MSFEVVYLIIQFMSLKKKSVPQYISTTVVEKQHLN